MGFQTSLDTRQAPAVQGDFASDNPRSFYLAGPGGLVAGSSGLIIGRAAWVWPNYLDWDNGPTIAANTGSGAIAGIVTRRQAGALITTYLADNSLTIPQGFMVELLTAGDVWLKNSAASGQTLAGYKAYANYADGQITFAPSGAGFVTGAASAATASIAAGTAATFTGSISGNVLTATGTVTNTIYPGAIVSGGTVATGTWIVAQLTGTAGKAGTYAVSIPEQTVASASLTVTPSTFTPGTMQANTVSVGQVILTSVVNSGTTYTTSAATTGVIVGMAVQAAITGTTWSLSPAFGTTAAGTLTSGTVALGTNVETKFVATNGAAAGELVRCSSERIGA